MQQRHEAAAAVIVNGPAQRWLDAMRERWESLAAADRVLMLDNAVYEVIRPEDAADKDPSALSRQLQVDEDRNAFVLLVGAGDARASAP